MKNLFALALVFAALLSNVLNVQAKEVNPSSHFPLAYTVQGHKINSHVPHVKIIKHNNHVRTVLCLPDTNGLTGCQDTSPKGQDSLCTFDASGVISCKTPESPIMQDLSQCVLLQDNGIMKVYCLDICGGRSEVGSVCSYE